MFCILPLILPGDPSYQMLTWSLSLKHWLLQQYVSKAHSILFHTVVPVLFPMVYNALLTETYALPSPLSSEASMSKASWKFMITPTFTIFLLLVVHLQETFKFKLLNSNNSNQFCIHLFSSHQYCCHTLPSIETRINWILDDTTVSGWGKWYAGYAHNQTRTSHIFYLWTTFIAKLYLSCPLFKRKF